MNEFLPNDRVRETLNDLIHERTKVLFVPELFEFSDVQDELTELGFAKMWLDSLPERNEAYYLSVASLVEIGKRMRAMQQDYFRTRNLKTLRECMKIEREFDDLLEKMEERRE